MARDVRVAILGDSRDFSRAVRNVQGDARKLDHTFSGIGGAAARMGKAAVLGAAGVTIAGGLVVKSFVDAAIESQKVTKQTEAVIKSMGAESWATSEAVAELSTKLSMQAGIDDELIQAGSNVLLTFANVRNSAGKSNRIFDRATEAALDMSVALGKDMAGSAMLVGKALNDPIRGLAALRRSGIQFTEQQEDQIKAMVESGDLLGAQKVLLAELEKQFGGSAAAQATAGEKLAVIWGNLQEQLGEKLLPIFEDVATWLGEALPAAITWAEPYIDRFIKWFEEDIAPAIGDAAEAIGGFIQDSLEALSGWWDDNGENIKTAAAEVGDALETAWDGFVTVYDGVLKPAFDFITDFLTDSPEKMSILGKVTVTSFGLMGAAAVASGAAATIAWIAPFAPIFALVGLVYGLAAATDWVIEHFNLLRGASRVFQWIIDHALVPLLGALQWIIDKVSAVNQAFRDLAKYIRSLPMPRITLPDPTPGFDIPGVPWFDNGGVMPGPRGVHSLAMVAGGETILPTHKGGGSTTVVVQIGNTVIDELVIDSLGRVESRNGAVRLRTRVA